MTKIVDIYPVKKPGPKNKINLVYIGLLLLLIIAILASCSTAKKAEYNTKRFSDFGLPLTQDFIDSLKANGEYLHSCKLVFTDTAWILTESK